MATPLPASPSLEQLKRRAKELLRSLHSGDAEAAARVERSHPSPSARGDAGFTLADAQLVIAREHGFPSWPRLKAYVERTQGRAREVLRPFRRDLSYYDERVKGLMSVRQGGLPSSFELFRRFHPRFDGASDAEIAEALITIDDARLVFAREHGFETWADFTSHLQSLARGETIEPFMAAFEALERHDLAGLRALLDADPGLARARGTNGNSLLNLAAGTLLKKDYSRPPELADTEGEDDGLNAIRLLLERGAEVNRGNNRGWTPLHDAAYNGHAALARLYLDAGAEVDRSAHGEGGTPLAVALFWAHRETAETLAEHGIVPCNLRLTAALGRVDLMGRFFNSDGALTLEAGQGRLFYRPHTGFPVWNPRTERAEILNEALVWAAANGRVAAMALLVEHGADVNAEPYRGTPLAWAAARDEVAAIEWLLDHGADVNRRTGFGGPGHGQNVTALHVPAQHGCLAACRALLERGADPNLNDALFHSAPWGWAAHFGQTETRDLVLQYAWRGSVFAAVALGDPDRLRESLALNPGRVDDPTAWGTSLGLAAMKGRADLIRILRKHGADPSRRDRDGKLPVDHAGDNAEVKAALASDP